MSCTLDSNFKDIDGMFNSSFRMSIWIVVPPFSKFAFWHNLWVINFWNNPLLHAKCFHLKSQTQIEHYSSEINTPPVWDSLLLDKVSKITPPSNANSCIFLKWGYVFSTKPLGYNVLNLASPFSGIVYWLAALFRNANEIDVVPIAFQKIQLNTSGRLELLTSI